MNAFSSWSKTNSFKVVRYLVLVVIIVFSVQQLLVRPFLVEGLSMYPTFNTNAPLKDYLLVERVSYYLEEPQRGDVVVVSGKGKRNVAPYIVKRVIGLPGETLMFERSQVRVTDVSGVTSTLSEPYINNVDAVQYKTKTVRLGPNEYYLLGDNRNGSLDSRFVGAFERDRFYGKVLVRLFPFSQVQYRPGTTEYSAI